MAQQSDTGGGGTVFCPISPSDNVGIVENLLERIQELEKAVSQLLAVNISATQLSDISQQIGWVGNITYMGQPGWTQTEYGTLIPPPGWSLSSLGLLDYAGNPYQNIAFDSDGNIQWAVNPDGTVSGASAGGGVSSFIDVGYSGAGFTDIVDWDSVTFSMGSALSWSAGNPDRVTMNEAGLYGVCFSAFHIAGSDHTDAILGLRTHFRNSGGTLIGSVDGDLRQMQTISTNDSFRLSTYTYFKASAGDYFQGLFTFFTDDFVVGKIAIAKL